MHTSLAGSELTVDGTTFPLFFGRNGSARAPDAPGRVGTPKAPPDMSHTRCDLRARPGRVVEVSEDALPGARPQNTSPSAVGTAVWGPPGSGAADTPAGGGIAARARHGHRLWCLLLRVPPEPPHPRGPGVFSCRQGPPLAPRDEGPGRRLQAAGSRLQAPDCRLQAAGCRLQAAGSRPQAAGCRLQAAGSRLQAPGRRLQAAGCRLQAAGCLQAPGRRLQAAGCRLQAPGSRLQAPGCRLQGPPF
eukprot:gene2515-biopygen8017